MSNGALYGKMFAPVDLLYNELMHSVIFYVLKYVMNILCILNGF